MAAGARVRAVAAMAAVAAVAAAARVGAVAAGGVAVDLGKIGSSKDKNHHARRRVARRPDTPADNRNVDLSIP